MTILETYIMYIRILTLRMFPCSKLISTPSESKKRESDLYKRRRRQRRRYSDFIVLLPHYKSIRLSIIFFIDLLKYNYLSRSEGQAKMVHSLFRSNACYFSFYEQTHICYLLRHNCFIPKNYYIHSEAHHHVHCNLTQATQLTNSELLLFSHIFSFYLIRKRNSTTTHITTVIIIVSNKQ